MNGFVKSPQQKIIPVRGSLDADGKVLYPDLVCVLEEFLMSASTWQFDTRHGANVAEQWQLSSEEAKGIAEVVGEEWLNAQQ